MDFSSALRYCKNGARIARKGWNDNGMYVALRRESNDGMSAYLFLHMARGNKVPWVASQEDLLANDWEFTAQVKVRDPDTPNLHDELFYVLGL